MILQAGFPFDSEAVPAYAKLIAARHSAGCPISVFDAQITEIVQSGGAVLVTRNTLDFEGCGFDAVNPWNEE
jgi:predicted nucleic acid-binding protein